MEMEMKVFTFAIHTDLYIHIPYNNMIRYLAAPSLKLLLPLIPLRLNANGIINKLTARTKHAIDRQRHHSQQHRTHKNLYIELYNKVSRKEGRMDNTRGACILMCILRRKTNVSVPGSVAKESLILANAKHFVRFVFTFSSLHKWPK